MGSGSWLVPALRLLYAAWEWFRTVRREAHTATVRAAAGTAWLRKHGGADERAAPGTDDAGGGRDKH